MSKTRQPSEVEVRCISAIKHKSRNSVDYKRILAPSKVSNKSPYTSNPSLPKTRSISSLNTKSSSKLRSNSPKLSKISSNNSSMIAIANHEISANYSQRSINDSYRSLYKDYPKVNNSYKKPLNEASLLEEKLKSLAKLPIESIVQDCFKIFEEIIEKDLIFSKPLKILKQVLEEWEMIKRKNLESVEGLKAKLLDANKKIAVMMEDRKFLDRRMHQISQENLDLVKSLEESEAAYADIEEKLIRVTDFNVDKVDKSQENWKALVLENKSYTEIVKKMKADLKSFKDKESKLLKLVVAMKNMGYPVEEIYNKEVYGVYESVEDSESDRIISGRTPRVEKPGIVPSLHMDKIQAEVFTTSNCSSFANLSI